MKELAKIFVNKYQAGQEQRVAFALNIGTVRRALNRNPDMTARRNTLPNHSKSSFNRITKYELKWHPYKIQRRHKLLDGDFQRRVMFCQLLNTRPQRFLSELIVGDEAKFRLDGHVCTNNVKRYADPNNKPCSNHGLLDGVGNIINNVYSLKHVEA